MSAMRRTIHSFCLVLSVNSNSTCHFQQWTSPTGNHVLWPLIVGRRAPTCCRCSSPTLSLLSASARSVMTFRFPFRMAVVSKYSNDAADEAEVGRSEESSDITDYDAPPLLFPKCDELRLGVPQLCPE